MPTLPRLGAYSRHEIAFTASALAVLSIALFGRLSGLIAYRAYPLTQAPVSPAMLALCGALVAVTLLPFCDRRGVHT
jgi:energy-coupling factor transport system permease protein